MRGDFTRVTFDPRKHYTRVLEQQGRVGLDADANESEDIRAYLDRTYARDVIGRCGVPEGSNGFRVEVAAGGADLLVGPGRMYVDGILCELDADAPVPITGQPDLPRYLEGGPALADGTYLVYADVWERHVTYVEDPDLREVALGGPDTATRTRTLAQVRVARVGDVRPLAGEECRPFEPPVADGTLTARADPADDPADPCVVPAGGGYRGLENRLYRVEIHDDGRDESGAVVRTPTFKWSRDNGSVVLPVATGGVDGDTVTVLRLGHDDVLTVRVDDWVEVSGDETELHGRAGTLAQVAPDGVDRADLEVTLTADVSAHAGERHLKLRRWDHHETDDVALEGGALPIQGDWFELEDGVQVRFDTARSYRTGDHWLIPARTREGRILWPAAGDPAVPLALPPAGIRHHHCTLALAAREGGRWTDVRDCRRLFPPLTEVGDGCCCVSVEPGEDVQQALDTVIAAGGGCVSLCAGVHRVRGTLVLRDARDVTVEGVGAATIVRFDPDERTADGGFVIEGCERVTVRDMAVLGDRVPALVTVRPGAGMAASRGLALRRLLLANLAANARDGGFGCAVRLGHLRGAAIDACRIVGEVGVLALWGGRLPELPAAGGGAPGVAHVTFDQVEPGRLHLSGTEVLDPGSGLTFAVEPLVTGEGAPQNGAAVAVSGEGGGQELQLRASMIGFTLPRPAGRVTIRVADPETRNVLRVNGESRPFGAVTELQGATVGGASVSVEQSAGAAGVRATVTLDGAIESFALGGVSMRLDDVRTVPAGEEEPGDLRTGDGVHDLVARDAHIRFRDFGLLAARAERWRLDGCDVRTADAAALKEAQDRLASADGGGDDTGGAGMASALAAIERLFEVRAAVPRGAAVAAVLWRDCTVRGGALAGQRGMDAWWWIRGSVDDVDVSSTTAGLLAFWVHAAGWHRSRIECTAGAALAFTGAHRLHVTGCRVRGMAGLVCPPSDPAVVGIARWVQTMVRAHAAGDEDRARLVALWRMLEDSVDLAGLRPLVDALQETVGAAAGGLPIVLFLGPLLMELLEGDDDVVGGLPVVDLHVAHDDIECAEHCVLLDGFVPLGPVRVESNRLHTVTGQAVRMDARPLLANAHLSARLFRTLLALLAARVAGAESDDDTPAERQVLREAGRLFERWAAGLEHLVDLDFRVAGNTIRSLRTAVSSNLWELCVADNHVTLQERPRVAPPRTTGTLVGRVLSAAGAPVPGATVRVAGTALGATTAADGRFRIENVPAGPHTVAAAAPGLPAGTVQVSLDGGETETVDFVLGGAFGLRPGQPLVAIHRLSTATAGVNAAGAVEDLPAIVAALERSAALEPLAALVRDGGHVDAGRWAAHLLAGPLAAPEARRQAADAVAVAGSLASDTALRSAAASLAAALRTGGDDRARPFLVAFLAGVLGLADSVGILARGHGCRIVGNHVLVPDDPRPGRRALGGIQLSVGLAESSVLVTVGQALAKMFGGGADALAADPLLGATDSVVERNEVVGGVGHGVSVLGAAGAPDFVPGLRVTGNQLRGMGGAGVLTNEHALLLDARVADNVVEACGSAAGLSTARGGIVVRAAALCTVRGNQVSRCGDGQSERHLFGIELDSVYGLQLSGNVVRANGADAPTAADGGVSLEEVYGAVSVHDNVLAFNRGLALAWVNAARPGEDALLPPALIDALGRFLRTKRGPGDLVRDGQASVQGNLMEGAADAALPLFRLQNLAGLQFTGNGCRSDARAAPLGEILLVQRGAISGNQLQTAADVAIAVKKLADGVLVGNVGNRPIQLRLSGAGVRHDFNVPPVTTS